MISKRAILLFLVLPAIWGNSYKSGDQQWKGSFLKENGIETVRNPKEPIYRETAAGLSLILTVQEPEDSSLFNFNGLSGLLIDDDNNIYALDSRDSNIKVFNARGKFLRKIGRHGQGPGELDAPVTMDFSGRHEIVVHDAGNRRLTYYGLRGDYLRSQSAATMNLGKFRIDTSGNIFCIVIIFGTNHRRYELQKYDVNLNYLSTIVSSTIKEPPGMSFLTAGPSLALSKEGLIFYGCPESEYVVKAYDRQGLLAKQILKTFTPVIIPKAERSLFSKRRRQGSEAYIPEFYPPYYEIETNENGKFIILARKYFKRMMFDFDIFDKTGRYLEAKRFIPRHKASVFKWKKDRLYVVEEDENGMSVINVYLVRWADTQAP